MFSKLYRWLVRYTAYQTPTLKPVWDYLTFLIHRWTPFRFIPLTVESAIALANEKMKRGEFNSRFFLTLMEDLGKPLPPEIREAVVLPIEFTHHPKVQFWEALTKRYLLTDFLRWEYTIPSLTFFLKANHLPTALWGNVVKYFIQKNRPETSILVEKILTCALNQPIRDFLRCLSHFFKLLDNFNEKNCDLTLDSMSRLSNQFPVLKSTLFGHVLHLSICHETWPFFEAFFAHLDMRSQKQFKLLFANYLKYLFTGGYPVSSDLVGRLIHLLNYRAKQPELLLDLILAFLENRTIPIAVLLAYDFSGKLRAAIESFDVKNNEHYQDQVSCLFKTWRRLNDQAAPPFFSDTPFSLPLPISSKKHPKITPIEWRFFLEFYDVSPPLDTFQAYYQSYVFENTQQKQKILNIVLLNYIHYAKNHHHSKQNSLKQILLSSPSEYALDWLLRLIDLFLCEPMVSKQSLMNQLFQEKIVSLLIRAQREWQDGFDQYKAIYTLMTLKSKLCQAKKNIYSLFQKNIQAKFYYQQHLDKWYETHWSFFSSDEVSRIESAFKGWRTQQKQTQSKVNVLIFSKKSAHKKNQSSLEPIASESLNEAMDQKKSSSPESTMPELFGLESEFNHPVLKLLPQELLSQLHGEKKRMIHLIWHLARTKVYLHKKYTEALTMQIYGGTALAIVGAHVMDYSSNPSDVDISFYGHPTYWAIERWRETINKCFQYYSQVSLRILEQRECPGEYTQFRLEARYIDLIEFIDLSFHPKQPLILNEASPPIQIPLELPYLQLQVWASPKAWRLLKEHIFWIDRQKIDPFLSEPRLLKFVVKEIALYFGRGWSLHPETQETLFQVKEQIADTKIVIAFFESYVKNNPAAYLAYFRNSPLKCNILLLWMTNLGIETKEACKIIEDLDKIWIKNRALEEAYFDLAGTLFTRMHDTIFSKPRDEGLGSELQMQQAKFKELIKSHWIPKSGFKLKR